MITGNWLINTTLRVRVSPPFWEQRYSALMKCQAEREAETGRDVDLKEVQYMNKWISIVVFCVLLSILPSAVQAEYVLPEPSYQFYIYDEADYLDTETERDICKLNNSLYLATGAQIVVVAMATTGDIPIDEYALELFNYWGVGDSELNNGYLLLMAVDYEDYYLIMGTGADEITDEDGLVDLLSTFLEPDFAKKDYSYGAKKLVKALSDRICLHYGIDLDTYMSASGVTEEASAGVIAISLGILGIVIVFYLALGAMV